MLRLAGWFRRNVLLAPQIFIQGANNENWVARDVKDATYRKVQFIVDGKAVPVRTFHFHPRNTERGIALVKTDPKIAHYTLYETRDLGKSWKRVADSIRSANWGSPDMPAFSPDTVFAILSTKRLAFVSINLKKQAIKEVVADGRAFFSSKDYVFLATSSPTEEASLFVSRDNAQTFKKIRISDSGDMRQTVTVNTR